MGPLRAFGAAAEPAGVAWPCGGLDPRPGVGASAGEKVLGLGCVWLRQRPDLGPKSEGYPYPEKGDPPDLEFEGEKQRTLLLGLKPGRGFPWSSVYCQASLGTEWLLGGEEGLQPQEWLPPIFIFFLEGGGAFPNKQMVGPF